MSDEMHEDESVWILEGVGARARKAAQMAAPAAGLSVAEWLAGIIRRAAAAERLAARAVAGKDVQVFHRPSAPADADGAFDARLAALADRVARTEALADRIAAPLSDAVEDLSRRLAALEAARPGGD